jgi:C4-dicarboxylate-specific signal transduction histidine kinase
MPVWGWILIAVAAVALLALLAAVALWRRRTSLLRQRFGREYDRTVERHGRRRAAEAELQSRVERRERLDIRPLPPAAREGYLESWRQVQTEFVDDPAGAVRNADALVISVMSERGYPMDDFERRAADVSVDYPQVVERYRSGHGIAQKSEGGEATTEDLRQAMKHYRALFDDLLEQAGDEAAQREQTEATDGGTTTSQDTRKEGATRS